MRSPGARAGLLLGLLLALTLPVKWLYARHPAQLDEARLERDLARAVAPAGYSVSRSRNKVMRFDLARGPCRATIAPLTYEATSLDFLRTLMRRDYTRQAEFAGAAHATALPMGFTPSHYLARSLAVLGIDYPADAYVLMGWQQGCPMPVGHFGGVWLHYRRR